ncbi:hypothetical protein QO206_10045 [Leeuwenhoekiella aequorea]|uniref:hypothetical protein n=1 Tax=Leeuwenhoekiella TaxID=283735 RepID=UPI000491BDED|nr:hypothetical protein [Leeuwenhoekiella sp. MAR_2009_132]
MNYIKHLNAVFQAFYTDNRLNTAHISLYMAAFQFWNVSRFSPQFYVNREELRRMAKIGSNRTYLKCMRDLHTWKYLKYTPSHNPFKGSEIKMYTFAPTATPSSAPTTTQTGSTVEHQEVNPYIKHDKTDKNDLNKPKHAKAVFDFFKSKKYPVEEAAAFLLHYDQADWLTSGGEPIRNWEAIAVHWMAQSKTADERKKRKPDVNFNDPLQVNNFKNYGEPL